MNKEKPTDSTSVEASPPKPKETAETNSNSSIVEVEIIPKEPSTQIISKESPNKNLAKETPTPIVSLPTPEFVLPTSLQNAVKVFVGQIPQGTTGTEIQPLFEAYGKVLNVYIIKSKNTDKSEQASCAFVTYCSYDAAKACIDAIHNQVTLPEGPGPLQISLAKGEGERLGLEGFEKEHQAIKLFFGMLPYSYGENEIRSLLCPGILDAKHVSEVHILRKNGGTGDPTGSAFVRVLGEKNAQLVIASLNEKITLPGAPNLLNISIASARGGSRTNKTNVASNLSMPAGPPPMMLGMKRPRDSSSLSHYPPQQRMRIQQQSNNNNSSSSTQQIFKLHVANLAFHVAEKDVSELFGQFGTVVEVYILRDRGSGQSKGAGFIKFSNRQHAELAIANINGTLHFGYERPLRVSFALAKGGQTQNTPMPSHVPHYQTTAAPRPQQYYSTIPTAQIPPPQQYYSQNQQHRQYPPQQLPQQVPHYPYQPPQQQGAYPSPSQQHMQYRAPGMPPPPLPPPPPANMYQQQQQQQQQYQTQQYQPQTQQPQYYYGQ